MHTKGPWNWEWSTRQGAAGALKMCGVYIWNGDDSEPVICDIPNDERFNEGERIANARLIAAAPDLLEACKELVANLLAHATFGLNDNEVVMLKKAECAITKALGESHVSPES